MPTKSPPKGKQSAAKKPGRKPGGQSKFNPDTHIKAISDLAAQGFTDQEIADKIGISVRTLANWKKSDELLQVLKEAREVPDDMVEVSLFNRALGYSFEETTLEPSASGELKVSKVVKKQVAPDVTAQIFWLKNRRRDRWRDQHDLEAVVRDYSIVPAEPPGGSDK